MTRIDRRALFTSGAAAALLSATGVSLEAAPRPGGVMRVAVPRDDHSLVNVARGSVFDTLTEIAPDGVLKGELATGWQSNADARAWTFDLRNDVVFHDGSALLARDVVDSLLAHDSAGLTGLVRTEVTGPLQLRLEFADSRPDLPLCLADPLMIVAPGGQVRTEMSQAVGTGLYRVDQAESERRFRARRVVRHYKDGRAGWIDRIEIVVISDPAVRAEALRDGYVDVAALPLPSGLISRGDFVFHPSSQNMALAATRGVGVPGKVSLRGVLDDGRIAERWWMI